MSLQPVPPAPRTSVNRVPAGRLSSRPTAARLASASASARPRASGSSSSATVLVEVVVVGVDALETATRLAGEIRDLVDSAGAEAPGTEVSASVGLQIGAGAGRATLTTRTPFGQGGASGTRAPSRIPLPAFVAPSVAPWPPEQRARLDQQASPEKRASRDQQVPAEQLASLQQRSKPEQGSKPDAPGGDVSPQPPEASVSAALRIYPARRVALLDGEPLSLTRREFDLLQFLSEHAGRVFDRPQLLRLVWGHQVICGERTVDVHIRRLRAKVEQTGPLISTVRGVGYRLDAPERVAVLHEG
jgi:hypothetical protein